MHREELIALETRRLTEECGKEYLDFRDLIEYAGVAGTTHGS
jgi:hypothetical protein